MNNSTAKKNNSTAQNRIYVGKKSILYLKYLFFLYNITRSWNLTAGESAICVAVFRQGFFVAKDV